MLELNKIYNIDCLEGMKQIDNNSVDLILTDPPYGIGKEQIVDDNNLKTFYSITDELYRVLKDNKFFLTFCSIAMIPKMFNHKFNFRWMCILYYQNNMMRGSVGFAKYSPVLVFTKGEPKIKYPLRDVYTYIIKTNDIVYSCKKPVPFFRKLLKTFSEEKNIVLDPFIGGGTTALACKQMERNFIGFEISKDYIKIANKRLQQETLLTRGQNFTQNSDGVLVSNDTPLIIAK